jgi:hypothetical protein
MDLAATLLRAALSCELGKRAFACPDILGLGKKSGEGQEKAKAVAQS